MRCAACGADLGRPERVGRRDACPRCGEDLHSCRNCRFHDRQASDECREPQAERVADKARANFCDYFSPAVAPAAAASGAAASRDALDRLFRKP
jgi:hypothetical protein